MKLMLEQTFWMDRDFDGLESVIPMAVYLYLGCNSQSNSLGIYQLSFVDARAALRMNNTDVLNNIRILEGLSKVQYSDTDGWIWVCGLFKRSMKAIKNSNTAVSVFKNIEELKSKDCPFVIPFVNKYSTSLELVTNQFLTKHDKDKDKDKDTGYDKDYEEIWIMYRRRGSKKAAYGYWKKISSKDKLAIKKAIPAYLQVVDAGRSQKDLQGWINPAKRLWDQDWDSALADWTKTSNDPYAHLK